jgi:hypothetical protein
MSPRFHLAVRPRTTILVALALTTAFAAGAAAMPGAAHYRPSRISPLMSPPLPGEGVWRATGRPVAGGPPVLVTTFRPERSSPSVVAYVAWIDHTRTQLGLYPGRAQPPHGPEVPSEVPRSQRWRLLATFNGGFKAIAAAGGFAVNGHPYGFLGRGLGTLIGYRDGRVDIFTWHGGPTPGPGVAFARQNLPLIVNAGRANPRLDTSQRWGDTLGGATAVWRTGVGVDRHGDLIYVAAADQTVVTLAAILVHAGAVRAIELDINPEWPTFDTYAHVGTVLPRKFVPNGQQPTDRYLSEDARDFFAVYRRFDGEPSGVPLR